MNRFDATPAHARKNPHPLGLHRVLEPVGVLPQAASRLDVSLPIYSNEVLLRVEKLNLDSASFRQLRESHAGNLQRIAERISSWVYTQGKMQNPVTGSGGMLRGEVVEVGGEAIQGLRVGDRVATLASLTLTPLHLEEVRSVNAAGQVEALGYAILLPGSPAARLPQDLPEDLSLAVLDVCGAPAWVKRLLPPRGTVLILGAGKSGLLSAFAALEKTAAENIWLSDVSESSLKRAFDAGLVAKGFAADARNPADFQDAARRAGAPAFDLVVNACNAPETETACILAAKSPGRILFFNMTTQFHRAVLSAEGLGREVEMTMGNGYAEGHAEEALSLVRRHASLREFFEK